MKLRRLLVAAAIVVTLAACQPDSLEPGGGSPSVHPGDHSIPASEPAADNPYDY